MTRKQTVVYKGVAQWHRTAIMKLVDNKVVFDCSDEEYGPIEFDIELLKQALLDHESAIPKEWNEEDELDWDVTLNDGLDDLD